MKSQKKKKKNKKIIKALPPTPLRSFPSPRMNILPLPNEGAKNPSPFPPIKCPHTSHEQMTIGVYWSSSLINQIRMEFPHAMGIFDSSSSF
jgi:hypothetical protein